MTEPVRPVDRIQAALPMRNGLYFIDDTTGCITINGVLQRPARPRISHVVPGRAYPKRITIIRAIAEAEGILDLSDGRAVTTWCRNLGCINPEHITTATPSEMGEATRSDYCRTKHGNDFYFRPDTGRRECRICRRESAEERRKRKAWEKLIEEHAKGKKK